MVWLCPVTEILSMLSGTIEILTDIGTASLVSIFR